MMLLVSLALVAGVLAAGLALFAAGLRAGDRFGETRISNVDVEPDGSAVRFIVENPGDQAVVIGASVRRGSFRLRCEGGYFVSIPRATTADDFLAGRHAMIRAIAPRERIMLMAPVPRSIGRHGELVVAIGEQSRLKVVHRAVALRGRHAAHGGVSKAAVCLADAGEQTRSRGGITAGSDQLSS